MSVMSREVPAVTYALSASKLQCFAYIAWSSGSLPEALIRMRCLPANTGDLFADQQEVVKLAIKVEVGLHT
jgi:hypothetical protein